MWSEEDLRREMIGKMAAMLESEEAERLREEVSRPLQETDPKQFAEMMTMVKENDQAQRSDEQPNQQ